MWKIPRRYPWRSWPKSFPWPQQESNLSIGGRVIFYWPSPGIWCGWRTCSISSRCGTDPSGSSHGRCWVFLGRRGLLYPMLTLLMFQPRRNLEQYRIFHPNRRQVIWCHWQHGCTERRVGFHVMWGILLCMLYHRHGDNLDSQLRNSFFSIVAYRLTQGCLQRNCFDREGINQSQISIHCPLYVVCMLSIKHYILYRQNNGELIFAISMHVNTSPIMIIIIDQHHSGDKHYYIWLCWEVLFWYHVNIFRLKRRRQIKQGEANTRLIKIFGVSFIWGRGINKFSLFGNKLRPRILAGFCDYTYNRQNTRKCLCTIPWGRAIKLGHALDLSLPDTKTSLRNFGRNKQGKLILGGDRKILNVSLLLEADKTLHFPPQNNYRKYESTDEGRGWYPVPKDNGNFHQIHQGVKWEIQIFAKNKQVTVRWSVTISPIFPGNYPFLPKISLVILQDLTMFENCKFTLLLFTLSKYLWKME